MEKFPVGGGIISHMFMKKKLNINYLNIIATENLLAAWQEFVAGKTKKKDVIEFSLSLADNILQLNSELANDAYRHGGYQDFYISDPKLRHIHKAAVRDRLVHHAIYRQLYPFFDRIFIAHSYSCRLDKGTHLAIKAFNKMVGRISANHTKTCWILQCDIRKFFDNINHQILLEILREYIADEKILSLLRNIISSYESAPGRGLPLGNLTSQLLVNIYMNVFDQYVKHRVKAKYYIRYADDFVFLSTDRDELLGVLAKIDRFLNNELKLQIHSRKIYLKTIERGVDFLGWVNFSEHKVLRTKTKRRMITKIKNNPKPASLASYLGMLKHGDAGNLKRELVNNYWINFQ